MASTVQKLGPKYQVTIPKKIREALGLKVGDLVEATVGKEGVVLRPKVLVDRDPVVEHALAEAEADVKAGRVSKPYRSARTLVRDAIRDGKRLVPRVRPTH